MTSGTERDLTTLAPTVFDTHEWQRAWSRTAVERFEDLGSVHGAPLYRLEYSPFWRGYEIDVGTSPVWDRPLVTVGSVYSVFGPAHLAEDPARVAAVVEEAGRAAQTADACGALVLNLPAGAARRWAEVCPPDARIRLDLAYHREPGVGRDPVTGDAGKSARVDWRRRWRRATEQGVRLVEETDPSDRHIDDLVALANGSAVRHGWPVLYDRQLVRELLTVPGARLLRADWSGRTVAGFLALHHRDQLHLWAGGMDPEVVSEVSPYLFLLYELLHTADGRGWRRLEFGRGNDAFKRRYGFVGVELWSLWYAARPADVAVYRPRLEVLHEGLAKFQGLADTA
jgi:hypothetical protein